MKVYTYIPSDKINCGDLGTRQITFIAWIDDSEGDKKSSVSIFQALVEFDNGQVVDVRTHLDNHPYTRSLWKDEILSSWRRSLAKQWDEVES